jgi:hypothetical protein
MKIKRRYIWKNGLGRTIFLENAPAVEICMVCPNDPDYWGMRVANGGQWTNVPTSVRELSTDYDLLRWFLNDNPPRGEKESK